MKLRNIINYLYIIFKVKKIGFKNTWDILKSYDIIEDNYLLDGDEYLKKYPKVNIDPIIHYLYFGHKEGKYTNNVKFIEDSLSNNTSFIKSRKNPLIFVAITEKEKLMTPSYDSLKITLEGRNNYLFLVNDSNNEIKQHFDDIYKHQFDSKLFRKAFSLKKKKFREMNAEYYFFIFPDKSLACKDYLPFNFKNIYRNYDKIKDLVPDFLENLSEKHYFRLDSHLNYSGGKKLCQKILEHINNDFNKKIFEKLILENAEPLKIGREHDLLMEKNWSYSTNKRNNYQIIGDYFTVTSSHLTNLENEIPEEFKFCRLRKSAYIKNENSFSNLKLLVFSDSFFEFIARYIYLYFEETFFYWDHNTLNKDLIEWYKPDIIIEIRAERFFEGVTYPEWIFEQ